MKNQTLILVGGGVAAAIAAYLLLNKKPTVTDNGFLSLNLSPAEKAALDNKLSTMQPATFKSVDFQKLPQVEKQNLWLQVIAQTGAGPNNTNDYGLQLMDKFIPGFAQGAKNNEILNQAVELFPDIRAASGFDNKYKILNPKLQAMGASFTLQRTNKTGMGAVMDGVSKVTGILSNIVVPGSGSLLGALGGK